MFEIKSFDLDTINISQFLEMYYLCFNQNVDSNYLKWKYMDNPAGKMIGFVAIQNGSIAGFYGVIPEKYTIMGKVKIVYQSMDTMTHPSYQKKGLFTLLANKTYEEVLGKHPDALIIGIPGSNSFHGFVNKLNWKHLYSFSFIFSNRYSFLLYNFFKPSNTLVKPLKDISSNDLEHFLSVYNKGVGIKPFLDGAFLTWRVQNHPYKNYNHVAVYSNEKMIGVIIYSITEQGRCYIEWIEVQAESNMSDVASVFCRYAFKTHKINYIYTWQPYSSQLFKEFKKIGFKRNPFSKGPFSYKVPFIVYSRETKKELFEMKNYHLQPLMQD